jgi:hypothetical protein
MAPKIVSICGSQRAGSFNKMLHDYAVTSMENKNGAIVTPIDLSALKLPLYDPNEDAVSFPAAAQDLKNQLAESGALSYHDMMFVCFCWILNVLVEKMEYSSLPLNTMVLQPLCFTTRLLGRLAERGTCMPGSKAK